MRAPALLFVFLCLAAGLSRAAEMRSIEIDYADGQYRLESVVWFDADPGAVYRVFRSWDLSSQFSSAIVEARDLEADALGRPGFYVLNRGCVLFFYKSLVRQGYVESEPNVELRAFADPAESDFEFSNETWAFEADGRGTTVLYKLHMKPAFWVPPAIGPWMIKRKLRNDGSDALDRIEAIARGLPAMGATH